MITIVIPTLSPNKAYATGQVAQESAGIYTRLYIVHDTKGLGFTRTVNRGLRKIQKGHICLLNDDVFPMTDDWLRKMCDAIADTPELGLAGPSGPCRTPPQNTGLPGDPYGIKQVSHLAFFCTLIKRNVIDAIGLLDEDFIHYGSDVDYSWRARKAGIIPSWVRHVYVDHGVGEFLEPWHTQDAAMLKRKLKAGSYAA